LFVFSPYDQYFLECSCYLDSTGGYAFTSSAFIFSLCNKEGLGPFKRMVKKASVAIYRHSRLGPTFGGGYDIKISNNANSNTDSSTDFLNTTPCTTLFQVEYKTGTQSWLGLTNSHLMR